MKRFNHFTDIDLKIDAENINKRVNAYIDAEPSGRKMYMKHKAIKTALIAATFTVVAATSAFAISPAGQEFIGNIISYFNNEQAIELTDIKELAKYNKAIGASDTKNGFTLTLDNVAADDNYVHVFYTIKSEKEFDQNPNIFGRGSEPRVWIDTIINGKLAGYESNHNEYESYYEDSHTMKVAEKWNISTLNMGDKVRIELVGATDRVTLKEWQEYARNPIQLTDDEKNKLLYVSAEVDMANVKVNTITKNLNLYLPWTRSTKIEKAIFSPFGNQLVVTTDANDNSDDDSSYMPEDFALYDENGTSLDILNTDLGINLDGSSRNALEFLKADANTKQLKFVPVRFTEGEGDELIKQKIGAYPIEYKLNDYGKIVVTDIRFSDGKIEIDYYKDGFVIFDPGFYLTDNNGNNAEPGGKLGCTLYTRVHHDTASYTAEYVYDDYDENGDPIPADESVSAETLKKNFTTLGVHMQKFFTLDFDNAVMVDLK